MFFLEKQHNFFHKTECLFIFTCHKVFYEFFQKRMFITGVTIAIVPKHNFPDISRGEHDKEGTAYLKYTKQKKTAVCTFTLWVNEGFCRINFFTKMVIVFLKSLNFERLSFRFLQQEKKVLLEIQNPSFTQRLLLL